MEKNEISTRSLVQLRDGRICCVLLQLEQGVERAAFYTAANLGRGEAVARLSDYSEALLTLDSPSNYDVVAVKQLPCQSEAIGYLLLPRRIQWDWEKKSMPQR